MPAISRLRSLGPASGRRRVGAVAQVDQARPRARPAAARPSDRAARPPVDGRAAAGRARRPSSSTPEQQHRAQGRRRPQRWPAGRRHHFPSAPEQGLPGLARPCSGRRWLRPRRHRDALGRCSPHRPGLRRDGVDRYLGAHRLACLHRGGQACVAALASVESPRHAGQRLRAPARGRAPVPRRDDASRPLASSSGARGARDTTSTSMPMPSRAARHL